jgi:hypothetical protein
MRLSFAKIGEDGVIFLIRGWKRELGCQLKPFLNLSIRVIELRDG